MKLLKRETEDQMVEFLISDKIAAITQENPKLAGIDPDLPLDLYDLFTKDPVILRTYEEIYDELYDEIILPRAQSGIDVPSIEDTTLMHRYIESMRSFMGVFQDSELLSLIRDHIGASIDTTSTAVESVGDFIQHVLASALERPGRDGQKPGSGKAFRPNPTAIPGLDKDIATDMATIGSKQMEHMLKQMDSMSEAGDDPFYRELMQDEPTAGTAHKPLKEKIDWLYEGIKKVQKKAIDVSKVLELAKKLSFALAGMRKEEWDDTPFPDLNQRKRLLKDSSEVTQIAPVDLGLPDDLFIYEFLTGNLMVTQYMKKLDKRNVMHILIDISGSMKEGNRAVFACAIGIAILREYSQRGDLGLLRFFDGKPHDLMKAIDKESTIKVAKTILEQGFSGGGTNIMKAIEQACIDIKTSQEEFNEAEVLLISDGGSSVSPETAKEYLDAARTKLHFILINAAPKEELDAVAETSMRAIADDNGALKVVGALRGEHEYVTGKYYEAWKDYKGRIPTEQGWIQSGQQFTPGKPMTCEVCQQEFTSAPYCNKCGAIVCCDCSEKASNNDANFCPQCNREAAWGYTTKRT